MEGTTITTGGLIIIMIIWQITFLAVTIEDLMMSIIEGTDKIIIAMFHSGEIITTSAIRIITILTSSNDPPLDPRSTIEIEIRTARDRTHQYMEQQIEERKYALSWQTSQTKTEISC
jgi:hypothetical protein